jgi:hypothetical protein
MLAVTASAPAQEPVAKDRGERTPADARKKAAARPLGPGGVGGRGAITPVTLIMGGAVQDELKVTAFQRQKIFKLNEEFNRRRRESAQALSKAPQGLDRAALTEMIVALRAENEAALSRVLEPAQRTRLAQIALRLEGPLAVARPEVADEINLSPDQREAIQEILGRYSEAESRLWGPYLAGVQTDGDRASDAPGGLARPDPKATASGVPGCRDAGRTNPHVPAEESPHDRLSRESAALRGEAVRQVGRVLTRKQKAAFDRLLGAPFDLAELQAGGRGPRPFRPASPPVTAGTAGRPAPAPAPDDTPVLLEPADPTVQGGAAEVPASDKPRTGNGRK